MKINSIELKNFRGFREAKIYLDGKCAVFYGINGVGKTSILRAIDLIYANIIGSLLQTKKRLAELNNDDIYDNKFSAKAEIEFLLSDKSKYAYLRRIDRNGKKTHNKDILDIVVKQFSREYIGEIKEDPDGEPFFEEKRAFMPIFVNYGVNRLVMETPVIADDYNYEKKDAFENAIESKVDFKSFFSWFRQKEDLENEMIARVKKEYRGHTAISSDMDAVRRAMLSMFPNFKNVWIDRRQNTLMLEKDGEILNINQLSDGEKCTIALFGDIARRMAIANDGFLDDPLKGEGVVLIDEVDLHLHPEWQRKIVGMLRQTFPNIQFIFTTHSPQVLGDIDRNVQVFSLYKEEDEVKVKRQKSLYGWDSNIILEEAMETPRVNAEVLSHIDRMYEAYDDSDLEAAAKEADWIDQITCGHNDCVAGMRVMISRKKRDKEREKNKKE